MIVSRSSGWLSRHGKPLLRSYEWHPAVVSPSLFLFLAPSVSLSLSAAAPPSRSSETERASEGKDRRRERKDKRRDRDAYNYLSFYVREPGKPLAACRSFSSSRVRSLIFSTLLSFSFPPSCPLILFHALTASRARFPSFLFFFLFFLALSPLLLMAGASDASVYERARDEREHEWTDGHTDTRACIPESRNEVHASERES